MSRWEAETDEQTGDGGKHRGRKEGSRGKDLVDREVAFQAPVGPLDVCEVVRHLLALGVLRPRRQQPREGRGRSRKGGRTAGGNKGERGRERQAEEGRSGAREGWMDGWPAVADEWMDGWTNGRTGG